MDNICDWEKCDKIGKHKAPIEKDNSKKFRWLCENHIKIFNKKWDYFNGMSEDQIKIFIESDMTWHRPTQSFDSPDNFFNVLWNNALNEKDKINSMYQKMRFKTNNTLSSKDVKAFKIMGLKVNSNWPIIQKKFKTLVKKFHPDMNSGSRLYEEKLKQITLAYNHLKLVMRENKQ